MFLRLLFGNRGVQTLPTIYVTHEKIIPSGNINTVCYQLFLNPI